MEYSLNNKGSVLFMVIICSVIIMYAGLAYMSIIEREQIAALKEIRAYRALCLAESGLERAKSWLISFPLSYEATYGTNQVNPFVSNWNSVAGSPGEYSVMVYPSTENVRGSSTRYYTVTSTG